jgi:hypothetical protein
MGAHGVHDLVAGSVGEDEVGDHHVVGDGLRHELGDVGGLAHDDEVGLVAEEHPDARPDDGVIIDDEDPAGSLGVGDVDVHYRAPRQTPAAA